jgi:hypothetical protein
MHLVQGLKKSLKNWSKDNSLKMNTAIIRRKGREERKAQTQKSLYSEKIIRTGTRMPRIGRIHTDPGAQRLEKAPEHGDAMIVSLPRNNKPQIKGAYKIFMDADITLIRPGI